MVEYSVLARVLKDVKIDLVIDVGANIGQYGLLLRQLRYRGRILSIEPMSRAHGDLTKTAQGDANWVVLPPMAVGACKSEAVINVSSNSVSSSLLQLLPAHLEAAASSSYISTETVPVERLDDCLLGKVDSVKNKILLKIDTQGFEDAVLDGAVELLRHVEVVQCELSLRPLYEGQKLIEDIISRFRSIGFIPIALVPGFKDPVSRELLQCDGFFRRLH